MRRARLPFWVLLLGMVLLAVPSLARDTATVVRVVDGDTLAITLKGRPEKVRLIGVDTPEVYESDKLHRDAARTGQDEQMLRLLVAGRSSSSLTRAFRRAICACCCSISPLSCSTKTITVSGPWS